MASETRQGDPAFAGDDRITHEPVVEEQRLSPLPGGDGGPRPFPVGATVVALAFAVAAVVAGIAAGGSYTVPFLVLAGLIVGFALLHRAIAAGRSGGSDDPVPNIDFDPEQFAD